MIKDRKFLQRTEALIGSDNLDKIIKSKVAIFGIGGVGSFAFESLVRSGVSELLIVDYDTVDITNINRQLIALHSTIGMYKVDVAKKRAMDISPEAIVNTANVKVTKENIHSFNLSEYDYIIDAIDDINSKVELIKYASEHNISIISSMGAGKKLDPTQFEIADIFETSVCPMAKIMRKKLRDENISKLKVVYSKEKPLNTGHNMITSISFVPSTVGLILSSEVIREIIK